MGSDGPAGRPAPAIDSAGPSPDDGDVQKGDSVDRHSIKAFGFVLVLGAALANCSGQVKGLMAPAAGPSAKNRRGADLVVTRLGGRVAGELVAVKPDSLLLLTAEGRDESVAKSDFRAIRIVRRSRAGRGALIGALGGISAGVGLGLAVGEIDEYTRGQAAAMLGLSFGALGAMGGLFAGMLRGVDGEVIVAGVPEEALARFYVHLQKCARIGSPPPRRADAKRRDS